MLRWLRLAGFTVLVAGGMTAVAALVRPDSAAAAAHGAAAVAPGWEGAAGTATAVGTVLVLGAAAVARHTVVRGIERAFGDVQVGLKAWLDDIDEARWYFVHEAPAHRPYALRLLEDAEAGFHQLGRRLSAPGGWLLLPGRRSALAGAVADGLAEIGVVRRFHDLLVLGERGVEPGAQFWAAAVPVLAELDVMAREPVGLGQMRRRLLDVLAPAWARTTPDAQPWAFLDAPPPGMRHDRLDRRSWSEWSRRGRLSVLVAALIEPELAAQYAQKRLFRHLSAVLAEGVVELEFVRAERGDVAPVLAPLLVVELGLEALDQLLFWEVPAPEGLRAQLAAARAFLPSATSRDEP